MMANESSGTGFVTLYTNKAHIFHINPETNNSWIQEGQHALPISIVATVLPPTNDTVGKQQLRLIGVDDNKKTVLNTTILPTTIFKKRAQKFGQWVDDMDILHGLGFNSEEELEEFMETFQQSQSEIYETNSPYPTQHTQTNLHQQQKYQLPHPQRLKQQPSTSIANSQPIDQPDKADSMWAQQQQHQQLNNDASEMNGSNQKAIRYNQNNNNINMKSHQFNSNTLAHPGHQIKNQQQPLNQPSQLIQQQHQQRQILSQSNLNSTTTTTSTTTNGNLSLNNGNTTLNGANNIAAYPRSQSMFGIQQGKVLNNNNNQKSDVMSLRSAGGGGTPDTESSTGLIQNDWQIREQLKYENDRLKQALEESSRNAGVWHNELLTLRTNNVKLTQALEESKANVEEWEKELKSLTEENKELNLRLSVLESGNDVDNGSEHKIELQKYKSYVDEVQSELRRKEIEIEKLQKSIELKAKQQNGHADESTNSYSINPVHKHKLEDMSNKFGKNISELLNLQKELAQFLDRLNI